MGPIRRASLEFGDLTVLVGPQASGKSVALQALKLVIDHASIAARLRREGLDWRGELPTFLDLYFGEGMRHVWERKTSLCFGKKSTMAIDIAKLVTRRTRGAKSSVFYVPAHRALTLKNGWPRHFGDYSSGDPFVVRDFSEHLRLLMESGLGGGDAVFPMRGRLTSTTRKLVQQGVFGDYELQLDRGSPQKRLVLRRGTDGPLPFMVWSAGQREFSPLLLGLYHLMPPGAVSKRSGLHWAILEEPEMGLHPRAITAVLFLILELLRRGYRICVSTHSPHILDLVWALRVFREGGAEAKHVLSLFGVPSGQKSKEIASAALEASVRVYYFDRQAGTVADISRLDPASDQASEETWGGLIEFSTNVSDVVADFVANS